MSNKHLHHWIDLIFGEKQKGDSAFYSNNMFYPLTYEENVKLDDWTNEFERTALEIQIQGFGQTPKQIFTEPHPQSMARKLIVSQPSPVSDSDKDSVIWLLKQEVADLKAELAQTKKKSEDMLFNQNKQFEVIEAKRKKKNDKCKKEFDKQIEEYQGLVEQCKLRASSIKEEMTESFREKESQYKNIIDNLRNKKSN